MSNIERRVINICQLAQTCKPGQAQLSRSEGGKSKAGPDHTDELDLSPLVHLARHAHLLVELVQPHLAEWGKDSPEARQVVNLNLAVIRAAHLVNSIAEIEGLPLDIDLD